MKPHDPVGDDEILYRATRPNEIVHRGGRVVISPKAFNDSSQEISVDRAQLQANDPLPTLHRLPEADGVLRLIAREARNVAPIDHIFRNERGKVVKDDLGAPVTTQSDVDVYPDPCPLSWPDNEAHALIKGTPEFGHKNMFKKLTESLALKADVEIAPPNLQISE